MDRSAPLLIGAGFGLVALVAVYLVGRKAVEVGAAVVPYINPADSRNLVYDGVIGSVGRAASGDPSWSLGTWAFELLNPDKVAAERAALGTVPAPKPRAYDPR